MFKLTDLGSAITTKVVRVRGAEITVRALSTWGSHFIREHLIGIPIARRDAAGNSVADAEFDKAMSAYLRRSRIADLAAAIDYQTTSGLTFKAPTEADKADKAAFQGLVNAGAAWRLEAIRELETTLTAAEISRIAEVYDKLCEGDIVESALGNSSLPLRPAGV